MFRFEWNALRVGDHVLVHDDATAAFDLDEGLVQVVETRPGHDHDVAIRLTATNTMTRPRRHAVHIAPLDRRSWCWRCDETAAQSPTARPAVAV